MPTPENPGHAPHGSTTGHEQHGISSTGHGAPTPGYETSDIKVTGIVVFMASLFVFVLIFFVFCFGMGKVINNALIKNDGPSNKWNQFSYSSATPGKNLESNAVLEQKQLHAMTERFPTPQLQMDDGNQDVADMHAREDLLLDHYTWVNQQQGTVRIPIGMAMEVIAQRGLPVANSQVATQPMMTADVMHQATMPLTNGFARTGYEQQLEVEQSRQQDRQKESRPGDQAQKAAKPGDQAQLSPVHHP